MARVAWAVKAGVAVLCGRVWLCRVGRGDLLCGQECLSCVSRGACVVWAGVHAHVKFRVPVL